ncbi:ABC transporter ATP-binding protein [Clostridium sp. JN-9]|uniref:ABC transporter ATP-binding protein n=1 Tax=Clostridium sp. JN-9 TaxID=2507159 RepID=UPI000FFE0E53|nr:ABC transporter ATP-binding protein [Clostridium sp. JN-9]QAT39514.1 ABC transporter ATP-binding protein [Clostridium sp. JN-9]
MNKIRSLFKYTNKYRKRYLIGLIFLISVDLLQLVPAKLIGFITDNISRGTATPKLLMKYIILIIVVAVLMAVGRFVWRIFIVGTSRYVEYDMRNIFFTHLQKLSLNFFNKNKTGDLMALATNDLNAVRMALGPGVIMMTDSIVLSIATLIIMLTINVKLTLLSLIPLPFISLIALKFGGSIHKKFMRVQENFSKLTDMVQENFSGIRVIKSFVQEAEECKRFTKENQKYFDANMDFIKVWGLFSPLIEFVASLSFVLLIGIGGISVIYGQISLGDFISFNMYLGNLVWPMMAIGWVINIIQRGFASLERIEKVLSEKPEILDCDAYNFASLQGDIEIKDLTFYYEKSSVPALKNINLKIPKGSTLGIIGRTGSGKTTLVNLLLRLYNVEPGKISFNGLDINKIPLKTLRENIGFVSQDAFLFSTSIAENINLPCEDFNMDKIEEASKNADIYDDIIEFPEGYNQVVGERGVTLSGGQKQRISIARALIKDPEILIFDDCLSAVDAKTEVKILGNLKRIMSEKTSLIISHRISAVKDSNLIAVLDEGEIKELGTHEELLDLKGLYYDIYEKQLLEEKIAEEGDIV